ncbi:DUF1592 domain-containing protein [Schlesneria sp. T3-172]|uniref:DUF1592 domain-containing protein n=1 Tax=Schlesneria sphaerica TaxID=3373610 RepID=UPI0037C5783C
MLSISLPSHSSAKCLCLMLLMVFGGMLSVAPVLAGESGLTGEAIYQQKCGSCHGAQGEGKTAEYPHPLVGDRSIGELAEYISRTMPEDNPGTCTGEEAQRVAEFIHEAFYSATAQARNKPARIELSRLTVRQYRNVMADLMSEFLAKGSADRREGLCADYHKGRNVWADDKVIDRLDPQIAFDFQDKSPDADAPDGPKMEPYEFSIKWHGSVYAPETGDYQFTVRTDQSMRFYLNDFRQPLVDAHVKSGSDTVYSNTIYLIGGRYYPLRLEFSKASQGVQDDKVKQRPPAPASVFLEWKRPDHLEEVVPSRFLIAGMAAPVFVVSTPFPPDDRSLGWERATTISKDWDEAATEAAFEVASYVTTHHTSLAGVEKDAPDYPAKLKAFCERFVELAFRRPLTPEQRELYIERQFAGTPDLEAALNRVVLLTLKSPRFLYREIGGSPDQVDDPYHVASRISFGMWDSLPDRPLLDAASRGELKTREQIIAQAERMVSDDRTTSKLREFFLRWLKVDRGADLSKDPVAYGDFNETLANDLRTSLELFLDDVLTSETADFRALLLSEELYLNGRLAKFYGADLAEDAPFQKTSLEPGERAGVLSHPYMMTGFAYTATSSPIHRGVFVSRSVLGRTLRPPPEAVTPLAPQLQPDLTTRDRVALQTSPENCLSCHSLINPLGFTMEKFDAVGRFRKVENGKPIDATGSYRTRQGDTVQFSDVTDLARFLADSSETHGAIVEQLFHGMVKQPIQAYGTDVKESLREAFTKDNFHIRRLLVQIIATSALTAADVKTETVGDLNGSSPR